MGLPRQHPHSVLVHNKSHYDEPNGTFVLPTKSPSIQCMALPGLTRSSTGESPLIHLPKVTRDYFHNKWLPSKAPRATLANLPLIIVADIQQGNLPIKTDPALLDLSSRGWTIVHHRLFKRNAKDSSNNHPFQPSNQLSTSVFVKCDYSSPGFYPNALEQSPDTPVAIPVAKDQYDQIVDSVRLAINDHIQPSRISQGSSGSYFCRNQHSQIVGVFKPKDEEPYGRLNPKWTKWIHRHLFPCCFGRSCLIPNLGYLSEAAASLVDQHLGTSLVPTTHIDSFASPAFHYRGSSFRRRRRNKQADPHLRLKVGSFQCFLVGYRDASVFLRDHPWPSLLTDSSAASWVSCFANDNTDRSQQDGAMESDSTLESSAPSSVFRWTPPLQLQFRLQIERLVILDYLIRNTDRGLDNWMIKFCTDCDKRQGHLHVAAIDNGLAFPFKHPDAFRSYPYGWLGLPNDLIGQPFSLQTRTQFLPLLSDPVWWQQLVTKLEQLFGLDSDFNQKMFQRQMAVLRGQGYNLVKALKDHHAGPLDLVAMDKRLVYQEEVYIEYDDQLLTTRSSTTPSPSTTITTNSTALPTVQPLPTSDEAQTQQHSSARLRPKRSTSFHLGNDLRKQLWPPVSRALFMSTHDCSAPIRPHDEEQGFGPHDSSDDDDDNASAHPRHSLDTEHRPTSRDDSHLFDNTGPQRHRVRLLMEKIKVVKTKVPYFTCC
ncbi:hypothetical protein DM01DRAFT_1339836 [Hesseltinella vesiculosa]|uniref:Phosphatidylinositol 4-kinase n=1 Tax=Hesseltinella vesiculosa TaxID=101127 RepID=A0A1X2G5W7_9FUNG|nr:hypothetical protein DM01DRAFT_1339836 [Hesseltinella vesiculosa]